MTKLTAQERAARARKACKNLSAEPVTVGEVLPAAEESTAEADAPVVVEPVPVEAEVPLDLIEARRAVEMAELREIEAEEEKTPRGRTLARLAEEMSGRQTTETAAPKLGATLH